MSNVAIQAAHQPAPPSPPLDAAQRAPEQPAPHTQDTPPQAAETQTPALPEGASLKQTLADKQDLKTLGRLLGELAKRLGEDATPQAVLNALATTPMNIHPDSSAFGALGANTTLASFISDMGLPLPSSHFELDGLAGAVTDRSLEHPFSDFGGALSWPQPLSADEQRRLRLFTMSHAHPLGDHPLVMQKKGVLDFLSYQTPLSEEALSTPAKTLEALLGSPAAQSMGKALQQKMGGLANDDSPIDYLLAAITVQMDPESITQPHRNKVAGYDLTSQTHWGKPLSAVLDGLSEHLVTQQKTTPELAKAAAHLLLASRAPQLLVKDIPASVTYGSTAWISLVIAARTIEAQSPGKVPNMTFAQVMLEAARPGIPHPAITQQVQSAALLDWGVANGVIALKDDDRYTVDELDTLRTTFNTRQQQLIGASRALDTDLPTRRELALSVLKERFGDLGPLFEEKLIWTSSAKRGQGTDHETRLVGNHSLLDIAMMDLPNPGMFHSTDSRIPLAALNANPKFGVTDAFNQQFSAGIAQKKAAMGTTIKHLITQLPLEDRKNFEFGKLTFYQNSSHTLGADFTGKTHHPKGQELLVKVERGGVSTAYEINVSKGTIEKIGLHQAKEQSSRASSLVSETKEFVPDGIEAHHRMERLAADDSPPDNFSTARTQSIADTFVQHLELDNPNIKEQARGRTTFDEQSGRAKVVEELLLNLIPFRSAIVNFQKGNYGEGATDLALDIFGFLTAGLGAAGKAAKVGKAAFSTATKAFKVAKIIGTTAISTLNPFGGVGDLAVGGAKWIRKGYSKGINEINKLRGAASRYDLLKAVSNEHGPALVGSFNVAGRNTEGVAVLRNDQWYHYNVQKNQAYGPPITDFNPNRGTTLHAIGDNAAQELYYVKFYENVTNARTPPNHAAYTKGYHSGRLEDLADYQPGMGSKGLMEMASKPGRPPHEIGILEHALERTQIEEAKYMSALLRHDVQAPGVQVTPVSQVHYLAHVDLSSKGECAGLSNAMALAIHHGKEDLFMRNMYRAAANPKDPKHDTFIKGLRDFQDAVGKKQTFHMGKSPLKTGYQDIIDELTNSPVSKTLRIGTKDHAMLAGIKVENNKVEWFFYEPNSGMVKFETLRSMQEGMEKALNSGSIAATLNPYGSKRGAREYYVSEFTPEDLTGQAIDRSAVESLVFTQL